MNFKYLIAGIALSFGFIQNAQAQCTVQAIAQDTIVPCNGSTILSVNGSGTSVVAFGENFNAGQPVGWDFSQVVTIANNTCGVPSLDGSDFMWMGNQSVAPRVMATARCFCRRYRLF